MTAIEVDWPQEIPAEETEVVYLPDMATPDQVEKQLRDFGKIQVKLGERVANLEGRNEAPKAEKWLKRNSHWFSPTVSLVGIAIGFTAGTGAILRFLSMGVDQQIDAKLAKPVADLHQLQIDVAKIGTRLDVKDKSGLNLKDFKRDLPQVAQTIKTAISQGVAAPPEAIDSMQQKFIAINDQQPGYWPAVAQFITYRSQQQANAAAMVTGLLALEKQGNPLVYCRNQLAFPTSPILLPLSMTKCIIDLDKDLPADNSFEKFGKITPERLRGKLPSFIFNGVVVRYQGGEINKDVARIVATSVFQECVFLFSIDRVPPKSGQLITRTLLESTSSEVDFRNPS